MPSIQAQFNEEVIQAHREALKALRELLAEETDPLERRRLAVAILRTRPVKDATAPTPEAKPKAATESGPAESVHDAKPTVSKPTMTTAQHASPGATVSDPVSAAHRAHPPHPDSPTRDHATPPDPATPKNTAAA